MSAKNLTQASSQWNNRPSDERYWTLEDAYQAAKTERELSTENRYSDLSNLTLVVSEDGESPELVDIPKNLTLKFTNYSFDQYCQRLKAPSYFVRTLSPELAVACLNYKAHAQNISVNLLASGEIEGLKYSQRLKGITSESYSRIWNSQIFERLIELKNQSKGWRVPPARVPHNYAEIEGHEIRIATEQDCINTGHSSLGIKPGDMIAPSGIYASDRDMFVFMIDDSKTVQGPAGNYLARGFFIQNSEVGDKAFKLTTFLYDSVCGNHIVWGAEDVTELKIVHIGQAKERFAHQMLRALDDYSNASATRVELDLQQLARKALGSNRDEVIEALYKKKLLPKKQLELCYDKAIEDGERFNRSTDPNTAWGYVQGMTLYSQELPHQSQRVDIDRAAKKLIDLAL